jgi:hypothetical protein
MPAAFFQCWHGGSGKSADLREMLSAYEGEEGGLRLIRAARDLDPTPDRAHRRGTALERDSSARDLGRA